MFGFFRSAAFDDPVLGRLQHARGQWRGALALGEAAPTPLALFGSRSAPDDAALAAARLIVASFPAWRPAIEQALFEHHAPYAEAGMGPALPSPDHVWGAVSLDSVAVLRMSGGVTTELVYSASWDDDHLLGARFQSGAFTELCGSVLPA